MVNKVGQRVGRKRRPEDIRGSVLINVRPTAAVIGQEAKGWNFQDAIAAVTGGVGSMVTPIIATDQTITWGQIDGAIVASILGAGGTTDWSRMKTAERFLHCFAMRSGSLFPQEGPNRDIYLK